MQWQGYKNNVCMVLSSTEAERLKKAMQGVDIGQVGDRAIIIELLGEGFVGLTNNLKLVIMPPVPVDICDACGHERQVKLYPCFHMSLCDLCAAALVSEPIYQAQDSTFGSPLP